MRKKNVLVKFKCRGNIHSEVGSRSWAPKTAHQAGSHSHMTITQHLCLHSQQALAKGPKAPDKEGGVRSCVAGALDFWVGDWLLEAFLTCSNPRPRWRFSRKQLGRKALRYCTCKQVSYNLFQMISWKPSRFQQAFVPGPLYCNFRIYF